MKDSKPDHAASQKEADMQRLMLIAALACLALTGTARAQTGPDYLFWRVDSSVLAIEGALNDLGLSGTSTAIYDTFIRELDRRQWPLIIIRRIDAIHPILQAELIDRLEAQLDGGARMLVHLAELEDMPRMQAFLGLEGAEDIPFARRIELARIPAHPAAFGGFLRASSEPVGDEFGATLFPSADAKPIFQLVGSEAVVSVLSRNGQIIVNGWEPNGWGGADGRIVAIAQIEWLTSCPADLTGDGRCDLFDFLEFQTLFMAGDPRADWFCYDGKLDIFDFLGFLNQSELPCR